MLKCEYCGRENGPDVFECPQCGTETGLQDLAASEHRNLISQVLIGSDHEGKLWSKDQVEAAQQALRHHFKTIPTIDSLCGVYGQARLEDAFKVLIQERRQLLQDFAHVLAVQVPERVCHLCGCMGDVQRFPFGLAKIVSKKRDWSSVVVAGFISAIALPLFGRVFFATPSTKTKANIVRLELQVCHSCVQPKKSFFNQIKLRRNDYATHPRWNCAMEVGFKKFLGAAELSKYK